MCNRDLEDLLDFLDSQVSQADLDPPENREQSRRRLALLAVLALPDEWVLPGSPVHQVQWALMESPAHRVHPACPDLQVCQDQMASLETMERTAISEHRELVITVRLLDSLLATNRPLNKKIHCIRNATLNYSGIRGQMGASLIPAAGPGSWRSCFSSRLSQMPCR